MEHHIVIVGCGPRGTYCFRRLSLQLGKTPLRNTVHIHVVEKSGRFGGGGIHSVTQPHWLLLNTVASQITAFGDDDREARASEARRTLHGYLEARGFGFGPNDYPPRALHGEYLADAFDWTEANLPPGVVLRRRSAEAVDILETAEGVRNVILSDGETIPANEIVLLTGHAKNRVVPGSLEDACLEFARSQNKKGNDLSYTHMAYPITEKLEKIPAGDSVYVIGMGLTAIDIIKGFTYGRGGKFEDGAYVPSGKEPRLILGSRVGLPFCARGYNQKTGQYKGRFLTYEFVQGLKQAGRKIDFEEDLLPTIRREMEYVFYTTLLGAEFGEELSALSSESERRAFVEKNVPFKKRFSWRDLENPLWTFEDRRGPGAPLFESYDQYARFVMDYMRADISEAKKGNMASPEKNAVDSVLRDLRDVLRTAVDHGGLTAESHRRMKRGFERFNNRTAVGPPIQSSQELLILAEQGIVSFSGPSPKIGFDEKNGVFEISSEEAPGPARPVRHIVNGRIHGVDSKNDTSPLIENLFKRGAIRTFINQDDSGVFELGGLDVTEDFHLISEEGVPNPHICALGIPLEGKLWFNAADARPDVNSNAIGQLGVWAEGAAIRLHEREK